MPHTEELLILRVAVAVLAAAIGGTIGIVHKHTSHRLLCALVSFAAGALLSVTILDIFPEAAKLVGNWTVPLAFGAAGLAFFYFIGRFVYSICPACAASATEEERGYITLGVLLMVTLGLHSTMDGIAIEAGARTNLAIGILILVAVSYHKLPEGLALVSVCRLAGYGRLKALLVTVLIEMTTGLGAFLGLLLRNAPTLAWTGSVLGFVAGSFLYVVGYALIKEMLEHERRSIVVWVVAGFAAIAALGLILQAAGLGEIG